MPVAGSYSPGPSGTRIYRPPGVSAPATPGPWNTPTPRLAWSPPPIPAGFYNPVRDIESAEGKSGYEQTVSGDQRQKTNAENQFGVSLAQLGQREGNETTSYNQLLERLKEGYGKLAAQQGDQANATGTQYGGAVLASSLKRTRNEGVQKAADERARQEQIQADQADRGRLGLGENERQEALGEALRNAGTNNQNFQQSLQSLEGTEAAGNGYVAPTGPAKSVFDKVNPANGEHFREIHVGGHTIHEYHSGRRVTVK